MSYTAADPGAVVLADGSLLRTDHDATDRLDGNAAAPHFRPYGPDLTGLFLGDCGALGVKAIDAAMARQRIRRAALEQGRLPEDDAAGHTLHVVVEGPTTEGVRAESELVTAICTGHGGTDAGPGPRHPINDLVLDPTQREALAEHEPDPEADAFVETYRREMLDLFQRMGTAHLQIGRTYPYAATRDPATLILLRAMKRHLDPEGLINPGVLGLP